MMKLESAWDFVGKYYHKYYQCDDIAHNGDLQKLSEKEYEDGDCAHCLLIREYDGDLKNPQIAIDLESSNASIYEQAIEGFVEQTDGDMLIQVVNSSGNVASTEITNPNAIFNTVEQAKQFIEYLNECAGDEKERFHVAPYQASRK